MKGRSYSLPSTEPPDDWGDGSWTVDCVCGVNFDDGEEMVNCDECGVWVHTRCSRFVKGETSFACDKCKSKKNRSDNEETEVAQLLVELPTKTMRMDNPYPSSAPRPSCRLWTDIPIEERVHVQGIPGGDPTLFQGLSSVFTSELWKCTGYVPKKFNFQYREFPCWDEKPGVDTRIEENESPVDRGADVLFSLSKDIVAASPVEMLVGLRGTVEGAGSERKPSPNEMKKWEGKDSSVERMQNGVKRERNHPRPFAVHWSKRKKEDVGGSKDRSGKKKTRSADKEVDNKKRDSTSSIDAQKLELHEDGGFKVVETDFQDAKDEGKREATLPKPDPDGSPEAIDNGAKPKENLEDKEQNDGDLSKEALRHIFPIETVIKSEKVYHRALTRTGSSSKTGAAAESPLEPNDIGSFPIEEMDVYTAVEALDNLNGKKHDLEDLNGRASSVAVDSQKLKPPVDLRSAAPKVQVNQVLQDSNGGVSLSSLQLNVEVKTEADDHQPRGDLDLLSPPLSDVNLDATKHLAHDPGRSSAAAENHLVYNTAVSSLPSGDHKAPDADGESEAVSHCDRDNVAEGMISISGELCQHGQELEGSVEPLTMQEGTSEPKHGLKHVEEPSKIAGMNPNPPGTPSQHKLIVDNGKSSSATSTIVISKSSVSGSCKPLDRPASLNTLRPTLTKRVKVNSYADINKVRAAIGVVRDDFGHKAPRKAVKEHSKASVSSGSKTSKTSRISHSITSKRTSSDSKEQFHYPSSKTSGTQNLAISSGSVESASLLQTQSASHIQNKTTTSGFSQKGERFNQSSPHHSSKVNHSPLMHPPAHVNSSATLSDEELALLLHQELNSSPRVPRVPRVRHAGSIQQMASPTATSLLVKRTSSSGVKDHILVSRRKKKEDASRDGSCNSREPVDETEKMDRLSSSPNQQKKDPVFTSDGSTKKEACSGSPEVVPSAKMNVLLAPIATANIGPSSTKANDQNLSSIRNSPRDISDDDAGAIAGSAPRTLPGLIDEIMSKGRHMTYEELCNAVLPHWHNLRKHNGERYAYSSHSQAVLDCLRNRNEWAQLVDRGPKTNAGRKRRKLDAEPPLVESEENEYKGRTLKVVESKSVDSQREDFPKGKRKARKRRRLALQGRKDVRKRRKVDVVADDDQDPFSHSSDGTESIFSEDENQLARTCPVGSEASTSSDQTGHML